MATEVVKTEDEEIPNEVVTVIEETGIVILDGLVGLVDKEGALSVCNENDELEEETLGLENEIVIVRIFEV